MKLLEVNDLRKYFPIQKGIFQRTIGYVKAVDGISFDVHSGRKRLVSLVRVVVERRRLVDVCSRLIPPDKWGVSFSARNRWIWRN